MSDNKLYKFPSIEQYRTVIKEVTHRARYTGRDDDNNPIYDKDLELPTLRYRGSVKLHGTNAGIIFTWNDTAFGYDMYAQSKSKIITPTNDNAGFAAFAHTIDSEALLSKIMRIEGGKLGYTPAVVRVYGEWCGGNIQNGMALNALNKMFVIVAIKLDDMWMPDEVLNKVSIIESNIYNILNYPTFEIDINFNEPKEAANKMSEMVLAVEKECPVGKAFGSIGIGEGIVWHCITEGWEGSRFWFKTKGDEHKVSGTKEKIPVDIEKVESMNALVDNFLTEARLLQGINYLNEEGLELSIKSTGPFLKWIYYDIIKEELDTIMGNGFEPKEISSTISNNARKWYFNKIDSEVGL